MPWMDQVGNLLKQYTDTDIHNLTAYLEKLK